MKESVLTVMSGTPTGREILKCALVNVYGPLIHGFSNVGQSEFTCLCRSAVASLALNFLRAYHKKSYVNGWCMPLSIEPNPTEL